MLWGVLLLVVGAIAALTIFPQLHLRGKWLAVAQAAYRESTRQPLFWLLLAFTTFFMLVSVYLPYFTFGEELKMVKGLGLSAILLATLILAVFSAGVSISEEIEGRTAVTVLSKPMSRRSFLIGKFVGIFLSAVLLAMLLSVVMAIAVYYRNEIEPEEQRPQLAEIQHLERYLSFLPNAILAAGRYLLYLSYELSVLMPAIVCNLLQVMILTGLAVALATRLPVVVNLVICLTVFIVGRLSHIVVYQSAPERGGNPLVHVMAQIFATILPGFNYFDMTDATTAAIDVPWGDYVFHVAVHSVVYTAIALLFGLILFEDRDVA
ncbi:MAG: ABC transporter permease subunit [Gemmatales bacterium]|nr:ABC transporter permease subunit [Gemmatales bacterium]MDW7993905.1 ABC transporter permease subunit [Gemmatales bacterium]